MGHLWASWSRPGFQTLTSRVPLRGRVWEAHQSKQASDLTAPRCQPKHCRGASAQEGTDVRMNFLKSPDHKGRREQHVPLVPHNNQDPSGGVFSRATCWGRGGGRYLSSNHLAPVRLSKHVPTHCTNIPVHFISLQLSQRAFGKQSGLMQGSSANAGSGAGSLGISLAWLRAAGGWGWGTTTTTTRLQFQDKQEWGQADGGPTT